MGCLCSSVARWTADTTDIPKKHRPRTRERSPKVIHGDVDNRTSPTRLAETVPAADEQRHWALASHSSNRADALEDSRQGLPTTSSAGPIPLSVDLGPNFLSGSIITFQPSYESPTGLTDAVPDRMGYPSSRSSSSDAVHASSENTTTSLGRSDRASSQVESPISSASVVPLSNEDAVSLQAGTILVSDENHTSVQVESSINSSEATPFSDDHDHDTPTVTLPHNTLIEHRPSPSTSSVLLLSEHHRNEASLPAPLAGTTHLFSERSASPLPPTCPVDAPCARGMTTIGQILERIQITSGQLGLNVAARDVHSHAHYYGSQPNIEPAIPSAIEPVQIPQVTDGFLDAAANTHMHSGTPVDPQTESIIQSLLQSIEDFRATHLDMLQRATPGTCLWILELEVFRSFQDPSSILKILWGSGLPGAGKTILASVVINILETHAKKSTTPICVCYVYFRYNCRARATLQDFLEVLIKQTLQRHPSCWPIFQDVYARHIREKRRPSEKVLLELLRQFSGMMAATFYILEALDEAPTTVRLDILGKLSSLNVKIFITSRPHLAVEACFFSFHVFRIVAQAPDLDLHIAHEISCRPELQILCDQNPSLRDELVSSVKAKCGGMFLHAVLQLEALRQCESVQEVTETLHSYPMTIEDVYLKTWQRILAQTPSEALLARNALTRVIQATRPLTIQQLRKAVAICPDTQLFDPSRLVQENTLISLCRGLLVLEEETQLVRLIHYTAKGVLERLIGDATPRPGPYPLRRAVL